ncbi:TPA: DUF2726 domain-containing protein [Escherichia coli]
MDYIVIFVVGFFIGLVHGSGKKYVKDKHVSYYRENRNNDFQKANSNVEKYERDNKVYRNPRWEGKDEIFWGMMNSQICLERKRGPYLCTDPENKYLLKLTEWFGDICYINCQVSLGQLVDFKAKNNKQFTEEERRRFFSIYASMAMDYVLVYKKTKRIVCVIELNDGSHNKEERIERDRKVAELLKRCDISFIPVSIDKMDIKPDIWKDRKNRE